MQVVCLKLLGHTRAWNGIRQLSLLHIWQCFRVFRPWTGSGRAGKQLSELATSANPQAEATADFQTVSHPVHHLARAEGPVQQADPELAELVSSLAVWGSQEDSETGQFQVSAWVPSG